MTQDKVISIQQSNQFNRKPPKANGHEIPLSSMIKNGYTIKLVLGTGEVVTGKVTSFDKYTITVHKPDDLFPVTYFKHAIDLFTRVE